MEIHTENRGTMASTIKSSSTAQNAGRVKEAKAEEENARMVASEVWVAKARTRLPPFLFVQTAGRRATL